MKIDLLNNNNVQGVLFPNNKFYRGNNVYSGTTLSLLNNEEAIDTVNGITNSDTYDFFAGKESTCLKESRIYQSKYDPDLVLLLSNCVGTNDNTVIYGPSTRKNINGKLYLNAYVNAFYKNKLIRNVIRCDTLVSTSSTTYFGYPFNDRVQVIKEDETYIYILFSERNSSIENGLKLCKYNKKKNKCTYTRITGITYYGSGIKPSSSCYRFLECNGDILKIIYNYRNYVSGGTYDSEMCYCEISLANSMVINKNINSCDKVAYDNTCILPSRIYKNEYYFTAGKLTNDVYLYGYKYKIIKRNLSNQFHSVVMNHYNSGSVLDSFSDVESRMNKVNGKIYEKEDVNGNKYVVVLNRLHDNTVGYFTVINGNLNFDNLETNEETIQEFSNVYQFIECDDNENEFLIGDNMSIKKISWNPYEGKFDVLSDFDIGEYYNFQLDDSGRIWVRTANGCTRILQSAGVMLSCNFEKETYLYKGQDIETYMTISLFDQNGHDAITEQEIKLVGPCVFTDTKAKIRKVTFTANNSMTLPITITSGGSIDCVLTY